MKYIIKNKQGYYYVGTTNVGGTEAQYSLGENLVTGLVGGIDNYQEHEDVQFAMKFPTKNHIPGNLVKMYPIIEEYETPE